MASLPGSEKIKLDSELFTLVNDADKALLILDGVLGFIQNSPGFINPLLISEALHSLKIDGYASSITEYYSTIIEKESSAGIEVSNYTNAVTLGKTLLKNVGRTSHIIKSIHSELNKSAMAAGPGNNYRTEPLNLNLINGTVSFPLPDDIGLLMENLDKYINLDISYPVLINAALIHAQFEMIHPFAEKNGLTGRILLQLNLIWKKKIDIPMLQISKRLFNNKLEYFDRLKEFEKESSRERWVKFFVKEISAAATNTYDQLSKMFLLYQSDYQKIIDGKFASASALNLFSLLHTNPVISLPFVIERLGINKQTANTLLAKLEEENILAEITGRQRNRLFAYKKYLDILEQ